MAGSVDRGLDLQQYQGTDDTIYTADYKHNLVAQVGSDGFKVVDYWPD